MDKRIGTIGAPAFPKGRQVPPDVVAEVAALVGPLARSSDNLVECLHVLNDLHGCLSVDRLAALARTMGLSQSEVYEVASFYAHFEIVRIAPTRVMPTINICEGPVCRMAGAADLAAEIASACGTGARIRKAPCVGRCDSAPAGTIGGHALSGGNWRAVVDVLREGEVPHPSDWRVGQDLYAYLDAGGYRTYAAVSADDISRDAVLEELEISGLRGLGGAGFPVSRKWRLLDGQTFPRVVVVNADEGEPGTFKDRVLLETEPHKVIEGALIAARTVGASDVYIYLRDEYAHIHRELERELAKLRDRGLVRGARTAGIAVHLRRGAGAYVCGEESALLESLEGKRGMPRNRPPFPAQAGLFGRPTLVNNVETLYWVTQIVSGGGAAYRDAGRPHFYSVSGRVRNPGVKLAPAGTTARQLINDYAGGMCDGHGFKAYLPGGASGGILPAALADLPLDFGALDDYGCFVGSSAVVVLSDQDDIRALVGDLLAFFADESCGQCTPCRSGIDKLRCLADAAGTNRDMIEAVAQVMRDGSICGLGQAAPNPLVSAMRYFPGELA